MTGRGAAIMAAVLALASAATAGTAAAEQKPVTLALFANSGAFSASGAEADGSQNIEYAQLIYATKKWGAGLAATYVSTDYGTELSNGRFTRSTMADSAITTFYNHQWGGLFARFGVDVGLPTGKATQTSSELVKNIADDINQDLLLINSYGSGTNVAGHMAMAYSAGGITWGLGLRYMSAGAYDPMSDRNRDVFDPGDSVMLALSAMKEIQEGSSILVNVSRTTQDKDKQDGRDIFRNGDVTSAEFRFVSEWSGEFSSVLAAAVRRQDKNQRIYEGTKYKVETGNANANSAELFMEAAYARTRALSFTGVAGFKSVQANDYEKESYLYDGGRTKWFIEPGVRWSFSADKMFSVKARYSSVDDKADAFSPNGATYSVTNLDVGVIMGF